MASAAHHNSTSQLLDLIALSDEQAFTALYYRYFPKLYQYALNILKQVSLAEEVLQDVFTKVWLHKHSLPVIANFEAYLHIATRNACLNSLRKTTREKINRQEYMHHCDNAEVPSFDYSDSLRNVLTSLPHRQRMVYSLHLQGFRREEIAHLLNISINTVKSHLAASVRTAREFFIKLSEFFLPIAGLLHSI